MISPGEEAVCQTLTLPVEDKAFQVSETLIQASADQAGGLRLLYNNTNTVLATGNYYNFQIDLICNPAVNSTDTQFMLSKVVKNEDLVDDGISLTTITVTAETKYGCALYQTHYILELLSSFKYLYVVVAFVLGLVECFYGNKIFKPTLFLVRTLFFRSSNFLDGIRCWIRWDMLLLVQYLDRN